MLTDQKKAVLEQLDNNQDYESYLNQRLIEQRGPRGTLQSHMSFDGSEFGDIDTNQEDVNGEFNNKSDKL